MCDRVVFIDHGRLARTETLRGDAASRRRAVVRVPPERLAEEARRRWPRRALPPRPGRTGPSGFPTPRTRTSPGPSRRSRSPTCPSSRSAPRPSSRSSSARRPGRDRDDPPLPAAEVLERRRRRRPGRDGSALRDADRRQRGPRRPRDRVARRAHPGGGLRLEGRRGGRPPDDPLPADPPQRLPARPLPRHPRRLRRLRARRGRLRGLLRPRRVSPPERRRPASRLRRARPADGRELPRRDRHGRRGAPALDLPARLRRRARLHPAHAAPRPARRRRADPARAVAREGSAACFATTCFLRSTGAPCSAARSPWASRPAAGCSPSSSISSSRSRSFPGGSSPMDRTEAVAAPAPARRSPSRAFRRSFSGS